MKDFADSVIKPYMERNGYRALCEIGARHGENTRRLLELSGVQVTVIDPCLDSSLSFCEESGGRVALLRGLSLDVLPVVDGQFDCILIDGDHNWYTVHSELAVIHERGLIAPGGTVLLHDVAWPYGRRDMYYQPDTIPAEFRHEYARKGIVKGISRLADSGGANGEVLNAMDEGGPRNGVLTAVEDFVDEHRDDYQFFWIDVQWGLGFLYRRGTRAQDGEFARFRRRLEWRVRLGGLNRWAEQRLPRCHRMLRAVKGAILGHG